MSNSCAILTPTHSNKLDHKQVKRLRISLKLNANLGHIFVVPKSLVISELSIQFPESEFYRFDDSHFQSHRSYNNLMLSPEFYSRFLNFETILILQTDAILVRNISPILGMDFNYLGAPWVPSYQLREVFGRLFYDRGNIPFGRKYILDSGNGGLSLRNVKSLLELLSVWQEDKPRHIRMLNYENRFNEDIIISFLLQKYGKKTVPKEVARHFFAEKVFDESLDVEVKNLFGFHALNRYAPNLEEVLLTKFLV